MFSARNAEQKNVGSLSQLGSQAEPQEPGLQLVFRTALGNDYQWNKRTMGPCADLLER